MKRRRKPGLDDRAYRKATAKLRRESQVCWICGLPIDITLHYTDPMSWTADHLIPRSKGGHLLGVIKAAHRRCNASRGNRQATKADQLPVTRQWMSGGEVR
ncbi:HNH endonuclease [Nocardia brasiliensis]|uniref:HNH endonuclease n=1 Tax=Nocardia brasiliensis TaxID=37326 RepID=UPI003CC7F247